jgi:ubiquinone/menaquinone biosynthesis C-methylase UbiE
MLLFSAGRDTVLEIGAGSGVNRKCCSAARRYLALEPEEAFYHRLAQVADEVIHAPAENTGLSPESVDTVVCCMVLCSVTDLNATLRDIERVLKPGGTLLLMEHVGAPRRSLLRFFQQMCSPLCGCLGRGCQPDRDTGIALRSTALELVREERFTLHLNAPLIRDWVSAKLLKH